MVTVAQLPSIAELYSFIDSVSAYPVRAGDLTQLAQAEGSGQHVVDFYSSFPADQMFEDQEDLTSRSEQVQIMSAEEAEQPWEMIRSPQE